MVTTAQILSNPAFIALALLVLIGHGVVFVHSRRNQWCCGKWALMLLPPAYILACGLVLLLDGRDARNELEREIYQISNALHAVLEVSLELGGKEVLTDRRMDRFFEQWAATSNATGREGVEYRVFHFPTDPESQILLEAESTGRAATSQFILNRIQSPLFDGNILLRRLHQTFTAAGDQSILMVRIPDSVVLAGVRGAQYNAILLLLVLAFVGTGFSIANNRVKAALRVQNALNKEISNNDRLLRNVFESGAAAIAITDTEGRLVKTNERWNEMFGEMITQQRNDLLQLVAPEEREKASNEITALLSGKQLRYRAERRYISAKGIPFYGVVYARALTDDRAEVIGSTMVVMDVDDRKRMEASLINRDRLLTGLADSLTRLLEYQSNMSDNMSEALAAIGWAAAVDRAYIFEEHEDLANREPLISLRYEWCITDITAQFDNPECQDIPWKRVLKRWRERLSMNMEVALAVDSLNEAELKVIEGQDIQSLMLVPIFIEDRLWGFAGFDDCRKKRQWTVTEVSILRAAAKGFGIALQRERAEESLILSKERAEMLNRRLSEENLRTAELAKTAREANETKSRFLANMSHEIRTPMNGVLGMCTVLGGTPLSDEQAEYLAIVRKSAMGLLGIIEDILDFSKIEAGKLELDYNDVDTVELIEDALDLFSHAASEKNIVILHHVDPRVPGKLRIDPTRLRQILVNLIGNAVKFTDSGYVILRVWKLPSPMNKVSLYFEVEDTGPGIHPEMRPNLFEAFNQLNSSLARKFGGTGLGLSISRKLTQMMGGDLRLMKSDEKGATFRGFIQAEAISAAWNQEALADQEHKPRKVLFIDADPFSRKFHEDRLRSLGAQVAGCASIAVANSEHANSGFEVVVINDPSVLLVGASDPARLDWPKQPDLGVFLTSVGQSREFQWQGPSAVEFRMKPFRSVSVLRCVYPHILVSTPRRIQSGRSVPPSGDFATLMRNKVVWVVDDNAVNLRVANLLLKRIGLQSESFTSGDAAYHAIQQTGPDIIFLDLQMPGMSGVETCREIRKLKMKMQPYIIAMTAAATIEDREACALAGMQDFVPKPVKEDQLMRVLGSYIQSQRL